MSNIPNGSPSPSHFSAISRSSSTSHIRLNLTDNSQHTDIRRDVVRWNVLRDIGHHLYLKKASSVLGSFHGRPTVLSANGFLCIGTEQGYVIVFDFKQQPKCVCSPANGANGAVTAVALSQDHTFLGVGYASGHINLFNLADPRAPARSVPPTSLAAVASGRKEGHVEGARIMALDFVGARHTAIVSADEFGLAFYHSLGKVLFVEANDTLRILGKYPETLDLPSDQKKPLPLNSPPLFSLRSRRKNAILSMASLPLGSSAHPIENYNLIALLTPSKLVVVGLKPLPRTWFRRHRDNVAEDSKSSRWTGCLTWFPSVDITPSTTNGSSTVSEKPTKTNTPHERTSPLLAYSWGRDMCVLRVYETKVMQAVPNSKAPGKTIDIEVGKIDFEEVTKWTTNSDYIAVQWLNMDLLLCLTTTHMEVWSIRTATQVEKIPYDLSILSIQRGPDGIMDQTHIAHCLRTYKGKFFLLGRNEIRAGTLESWADRILSFVEDGDFLSAIKITREYYLDIAPGNRLGLPDDRSARQALVGGRMRDLMTASARYAFAEERLTDSTHMTPDGRGVDRTTLFEGLVDVCIEACLALDDLEFVFEDLFEYYANWGITSIFLSRLEPFVLDGKIHAVPPRVTQHLVAMHRDRGDLEKAERFIWHIDPDCLDIDQAVSLCRDNHLYDALIYVYTRSLHDFVTPLVVLLELVRNIQIQRRAQERSTRSANGFSSASYSEEMVHDAYKVYTYLSDTLSGLVYPSQRQMPPEEADDAKKTLYSFLFFGRSHVWPQGEGGKLVLTAEEGTPEPTYPYIRLLLRFDSEAFLNALDIAFEDEYFNDDGQISRLLIIKILLEILASPDISGDDATMLNIFIARNVPKYPQSIHAYMSPSDLHGILIGLAEERDPSSREDRQLAAEYLLSVYIPNDSDKVTALFEEAGFYRILRGWYRHDYKWSSLISTYLHDPDVDPAEIFESLEEVLTAASRTNKGSLPTEALSTFMNAVPQLLETEVAETALLVDSYAPRSHKEVISAIEDKHRQFVYLRCLVEPAALPEELYWSHPTIRGRSASVNLDTETRSLYIKLLCRYDSSRIIQCLGSVEEGYFAWEDIISTCEESDAFDAVVWCLNRSGDPSKALDKLKVISSSLATKLGEHFGTDGQDSGNIMEIQNVVIKLQALGETGLQVCSERAQERGLSHSVMEDLWFTLLSSQIDVAQTVSAFYNSALQDSNERISEEQRTLNSLRSLVQTTFSSLMASGLSPGLSFPRLFKRLVDSASKSRSSGRSSYSEFRLILTGMLDSYRGEGELLLIANRLVDRDLFVVVQEYAKRCSQGSRIRAATCTACNSSLASTKETNAGDGWVVKRISGLPYHRRCLATTGTFA
ncbi:hypothetical protein M422DRAFT_161359 [Sphaerobolus stellatus SS14]|nr:hypothetical protein M422DRAFT_161359 [Sphaerobolus stellatus SS14]